MGTRTDVLLGRGPFSWELLQEDVRTSDTIFNDLIENHAPEYQLTIKSEHNVTWHNTAVHKCSSRLYAVLLITGLR